MRLRARAELEKRRRQEEAKAKAKESGFELPAFRGAALALQSAFEHEVVISGPYESGKTFPTLWRFDSLLREYPRTQALMVRKVRVDMDSSCIQTYRKVIERRGGVSPFGGEKPQWFDYSNGSRFWIAGLDNPGKALSAEYDFVYVNQAEQLSRDDWETLTTRCTGRAGNSPFSQIVGDCNPGGEGHWILKRQMLGILRLLKSVHKDNPRLYHADGTLTPEGEKSMAVLNGLTGIRRKRGLEGEWVGAEGLYFEEWDDDLHTCEPFSIPADWRVWGALDIGRAHPTAWGGLAENDGVTYLFAEHVRNNWPVAQHCKAIHRQLEIARVSARRVRRTLAGGDAFLKRVDGDGVSVADLYQRAVDPETQQPIGIYLERAALDRITGARTLLEMLGNREIGIRPRLQVFRTCPRTIATMKRMVHDPRDPEDVLKVDADVSGEGGDDEYDMLRYGVMTNQSEGAYI